MNTSKHAYTRMQQRGIPIQIVQKIITYGSYQRVPGGAISRYLSKRDFKILARSLAREDYVELDKYKSVYVILSNDNVVTVGHRTRRYYR